MFAPLQTLDLLPLHVAKISVPQVGGVLPALGLGSRLIALLLTANMTVAYITGDREALLSIFSNPDKFSAAAPFTYLMASLIVLIFGSGQLSLD
jgi:putative oxidoreductase